MQGTLTSAHTPPPLRGLEALRHWGLEGPRIAGRLWRALRRLACEEDAQDLAEYGISLAVIGAGAAAAALSIRGDVAEMWVHHARLLQKIASVAAS